MTLAAIVLISPMVGFSGGWGVKGWKDTAKFAIVEQANQAPESCNSILETANGNCATDIEGVKKDVAVIVSQALGYARGHEASRNASSLSDLKGIGYKSVWLVHISPLFRPIEQLLAFKIVKIYPYQVTFSLRFFKSDRLLKEIID